MAFRADGNVLYALNVGGAIAVFSVAQDLSLQLIQDAPLPLAPGQLGGNAVRIRLNAAGNKIAATTLDGWVYVGDVNGTDGTVSGITETVPSVPFTRSEEHTSELQSRLHLVC